MTNASGGWLRGLMLTAVPSLLPAVGLIQLAFVANQPPDMLSHTTSVAGIFVVLAVVGSVVGARIGADLRWLYIAMTLAGVGLCLAPRLTLPARLPTRPTD